MGESVFGTAAEARDVPRQTGGADVFSDAIGKATGEWNHVFKGGWRKNVLQRGAHGGEREGVSCQSAADAADVAVLEMHAIRDSLGDILGDAVGSAWNSAADGFAEDEEIGIEIPFAGASAGASADGVRFVGDEQRAMAADELRRGGPIAFVREDDPDVGHGGFGENTSDIVMLEGSFERGEIVELDDARGFGGIDGRTDVAAAGADGAVVQGGEGFVHGAVVAVMEHKDFRALRDFASDANGESIGVGGGERELPKWQAEAQLEFFAHPQRIFAGQHEGDAFADAAGNGFGDDVRGVAGHGAGVTEAEVDVFAVIDVDEMRAVGGADKDGESAGPFFHPVHGHAAEEGVLRTTVECGGARMLGDEAGFLALMKSAEFLAVDGGHDLGFRVCADFGTAWKLCFISGAHE